MQKGNSLLRIWCSIFHQSLPLSFNFQREFFHLYTINFVLKSFRLFSSQTFCSLSHSLISSSSRSCVKTHFDSKILFKNHLSQSVKHSFCEVGLIPSFSIFKSPFSHISQSPIRHGHYAFNSILFDDNCRFVFYPGGTLTFMLWAFNKPLDLRTDPLQDGGDDVTPIRLSIGPTSRPILFNFF